MPRVRGKTSSAAAGVARREGGACARVLQRVSACGGRPVTFTLRTSESGCFVTQGLHSTAIFRFERLVRLNEKSVVRWLNGCEMAQRLSRRVSVCVTSQRSQVSARASLYFKVKGVLLLIIVRYPGTPHAGPRPAHRPRGPRPRRGAGRAPRPDLPRRRGDDPTAVRGPRPASAVSGPAARDRAAIVSRRALSLPESRVGMFTFNVEGAHVRTRLRPVTSGTP
jgi:hypothetical protein